MLKEYLALGDPFEKMVNFRHKLAFPVNQRKPLWLQLHRLLLPTLNLLSLHLLPLYLYSHHHLLWRVSPFFILFLNPSLTLFHNILLNNLLISIQRNNIELIFIHIFNIFTHIFNILNIFNGICEGMFKVIFNANENVGTNGIRL